MDTVRSDTGAGGSGVGDGDGDTSGCNGDGVAGVERVTVVLVDAPTVRPGDVCGDLVVGVELSERLTAMADAVRLGEVSLLVLMIGTLDERDVRDDDCDCDFDGGSCDCDRL